MSSQSSIVAPPSSSYTIRFPSDRGSCEFKYKHSFYSSDMTDGRASLDEIKYILREIEVPIQSCNSKVLGSFCCLPITIGLMLLISGASNSHQMNSKKIFFILGAIAALVVFVIYAVVTRNEMKDECKTIVQKWNRNWIYRGLSWHMPKNFPRCIELHKEYLNQRPVTQPIYVPPVYPVHQHSDASFAAMNENQDE